MTELRPEEIRTCRWNFIDISNKSIIIPTDLMKTRKLHTQALKILEEIKPISFNYEYAFIVELIYNGAYISIFLVIFYKGDYDH